MSGDDTNGEDFCIQNPPLYVTIRDILQEYPDGQIFKEIIQNADDAMATEVKFFLDYRQNVWTVSPSLSSCANLHRFKGPALLAYNNAGFKKIDWEGIQRPKRSVKAQDCLKVGKFGSGFNSVYHISDVPVILSGDRIAVMDPLEELWPGKTGKWWKLCDMSDKSGGLGGFLGVCGFSIDCYNFCDKTIFRFPLRKQKSKLSGEYSMKKLETILEALQVEAKYLLLFLRSVQTIEVHRITDFGQQRVFSVTVLERDRQRRYTELTRFKEEIKEKFLCAKPAHEVVSVVSRFTVVVSEQDKADCKCEWLVVQQVGSKSAEVARMVNVLQQREESVLPWVGTAMELVDSDDSRFGRVFCFLPMPFEQLAPVPVHVNGTFAISKDRRSLKWTAQESQNDPGAHWNELLSQHCLPTCYKKLLITLKGVSPSLMYKAWPDPSFVSKTEWNGLLRPLYSSLLPEHVFHSKAKGGVWVTLDEALLVPERGLSETVTDLLLKYDAQIVHTTPLMWRVLHQFCSTLPKCVSPKFVTNLLVTQSPAHYKMLPYQQKLELLAYCMDSLHDDHVCLKEGLELLPLANGKFTVFSSAKRVSYNVYLCNSEFPHTLLPHLHNCLVPAFGNKRLQLHFEKLVNCGCTQVKQLTVEIVALLLPRSIQCGWTINEFKFFWKWVQNYDLSSFNASPIVPLVDNYCTLTTADYLHKVVLITQGDSRNITPALLRALGKIGVKFARQDKLRFLKHDDLLEHINPFTTDGVLSTAPIHGNIQFNNDEGEALQKFFASSRASDSKQSALSWLSIFYTLQGGNTLFSIADVADGKQFALAANYLFSLDPNVLPPYPRILALTNQRSLLSQIRHVHFITVREYICNYIFPMIKVGIFPKKTLNDFMKAVMEKVAVFELGHEVLESMKKVPFLLDGICKTRRCPTQLFDPNDSIIQSLYRDEHVFPIAPFNAQRYTKLLREAGLKCKENVTTDDIYTIVDQIKSTGTSPHHCGLIKYSRACAVIKFLQSKPSLLDESRKAAQSHFKSLLNDLLNIGCSVSWLPVCSSPPTDLDYPECLRWKGSDHMNCLASCNTGIVPMTETLPLIAGSQLLFMKDSTFNKLTENLSPPQNVLAVAVVNHFLEVVKQFKDIDWEAREKIVNCTYTYLNKFIQNHDGRRVFSLLRNEKWVFLEHRGEFVESRCVALQPNETLQNLEPFIFTLPTRYAEKFQSLFEMLGVPKEVTDHQIVSVLNMISTHGQLISYFYAWQMVINILHWIARQDCSRFNVLIPVQSSKKYPVLKSIDEVAYIDSKYLAAKAEQEWGMYSIVHSKIPIDLARKLGVEALSKCLSIAEELPEDVGQQESLIKRIKNILKDYKDGLTIIKELLQNADDAEATELNIIYDSRQHGSQNLLFSGMAKAHGPALIVHNDKAFSQEDFENITKLAGATKEDKPLKIGKFGVGFCSVYHITDVPSFVSGEWLYIFDPTLRHLEDVVTNPAQPGQKVRCTSTFFKGSQQLEPYQSIFGYKPGNPYQGTIFRLPFRTSRSEISPTCYQTSDIDQLKKQLIQEGSKLLLFLTHVRKITFSEWRQGEWALQSPLIVIEKAACRMRVLECVQQQFIKVTVRSPILQTDSSNWLVTSCLSDIRCQVAAVACKLKPVDGKQNCKLVEPVRGEAFCSLPLDLLSGLPVHVSANFAVTNDRRGIKSSVSDDSEKEVKWNRELIRTVIPHAYSQLLLALADADRRNLLSDYNFYALWPLRQVANPWDMFVGKLYEIIEKQLLFYSPSVCKWLPLAGCTFVSTNIFSCLSLPSKPPKCVFHALEILKMPVVDLPIEFHSMLGDSMKFIKEAEFIRLFFENISSLMRHTGIRNEIIRLILELYAWHAERGKQLRIRSMLTSTACIPSTPDGHLRYCKTLVDPNALIAKLFSHEDGYFPIPELCNSQPALRAMKLLGLQSETLSYDVLAQCARQIQGLYSNDRARACEKIALILICVQKQLSKSVGHCDSLKNIPFLPVMQKPKKYILPWCAEKEVLPPCKLMHGPRLPALVGSQVAILDDSVINTEIPMNVLAHIGVNIQPPVSAVISQLKHLMQINLGERVSSDDIGLMYNNICSFLEDMLEMECLDDSDEVRTDLSELKTLPCVWTGKCFVEPHYVAMAWKCDGPVLYKVPAVLIRRHLLCKALGCHDNFSSIDLLNALSCLHSTNRNVPLDNESQNLVRDIVTELDKSEDFAGFNMESAVLPDTKFVMQSVRDLVFNDVGWSADKHNVVNGCISPSLATKLRVKFIRSKTLQKRKCCGQPFGQRENLTQRIANILREYPFDVTFIKEFMQNADDAKATKLRIILDMRQIACRDSKMISDNWKELQGPALLVWNNSTFTENDMEGIQKLGVGGKRDDSETIGQFGVGFNVVYHITDCPSFITSVKRKRRLCVLDPLCRYVPEPDELQPGVSYVIDNEFWKDFSDMKPGYSINGVDGCPFDMKEELWEGTLFRLPIRKVNSDLKQNSIPIEVKEQLTPQSLLHHIKQWIDNVKLSLLFLNNLTDIQFYVINDGPRPQMTQLASYLAKLNQDAVEKRDKIKACTDSFTSKQDSSPETVLYPMIITSIVYDFHVSESTSITSIVRKGKHPPKTTEECWLVQEGVGDIDCPKQNWELVPKLKPRHGLATSLQSKEPRNGQIFCFLPLPSQSNVPVHINGQFMLGSTRRHLWVPSDPDQSDRHSTWNSRLLQAIASSYVHFLQHAIPYFVKEGYQDQNRDYVVSRLQNYYSKFPTYHCSSPKQMSNSVLTKLCQQNAKILCSIKCSWDSTSFVTEWASLKDKENPSKQSYMEKPLKSTTSESSVTEEEFKELQKSRREFHARLRSLLEGIGMNINSVPFFIWRAFKDVECEIPVAYGKEVLQFCKQFPDKIGRLPCHVNCTSIQSVENFRILLEYTCTQVDQELHDCTRFLDDHINAPFLLTADSCVRTFTENHCVILSKHLDLFRCCPQILNRFAHSTLVDMNMDPEYFYQPDEEDFDFVNNILACIIPRKLYQPGTFQSNDLPQDCLHMIWECISSDPVFECHLSTILTKWALIPSHQNQLFLLSRDSLLPVSISLEPLQLYWESITEDRKLQIQLYLVVINILQTLRMPTLDINAAANSGQLLNLCPSILNPESVLKHLMYLNLEIDARLRSVLFQYFSEVTFGCSHNGKVNRIRICSLPIFQNIDETLTCLQGKRVCIWPNDVEQAGLAEWLPSSDAVVFLKKDGEWTKLGVSQGALDIQEISTVKVYEEFVLPKFKCLAKSNRQKHLEHIRDQLLSQFLDQAKRSGKPLQLGTFPCIEDTDGKLTCARELYDPSVILFRTFSLQFKFRFPHKKYKHEEWLPFLKVIGLQQEVTIREFRQLCMSVAEQHQDIIDVKHASVALLEYLLYSLCRTEWRLENIPGAQDWTNDRMLQEVFQIQFIVVEPLPHLNQIVEQCTAGTSEGSTHQLTKLKDAAVSEVADVVWTVRPVVKLPPKYCYTKLVQNYTTAMFTLSEMDLIIHPSVPDVLLNVCNIAQRSEFTDLRLYDKNTIQVCEEHNLLNVMSKNFKLLSEAKEKSDIYETISSLKCIPVFAGNQTQKNWYVLVEPRCVIANPSIDDLQPCLFPLPDQLFEFKSNLLAGIGVKTQLELGHCFYALKQIYEWSQNKQVDANSQDVLEKIIKYMYTLLQDTASTAKYTTELYLPDKYLRLMPSTSLHYCDVKRYEKCQFVSSLPDSCLYSILWLPESFDGGSAIKFCELLPKEIAPKPFSSHCKETILSLGVEETNLVTEELQTALHLHKILHALKRILSSRNIPCEQYMKILQYFQDVLYDAQVVALPNLKIVLRFCNEEMFATCNVSYFIHRQSSDAKSKVFIDSSLRDSTTAILKVHLPLAVHMLTIASITSHEDIQHVIALLLKAKNEAHVDEICEQFCRENDNDTPFMSKLVAIRPRIGLKIPECVHMMLDPDMRVIFRSGEWAAFEETRNSFVFVKIVRPVCDENDKMPENIYDHQYHILNSLDAQELPQVSIVKLYKLLKQQPQPPAIESDADTQSIQANAENLILQDLDEVEQCSDHQKQQIIIERLFLQWYPFRNDFTILDFLVNELIRRDLATANSIVRLYELAERRFDPEHDPPSCNLPQEQLPNIPCAQRWIRQAEVDMQALNVLLSTGTKVLSGHVCFLAHEVAEKALKAGMYAVQGNIDDYLRYHDLHPLLNSLVHMLSREYYNELSSCVRILDKYYNKTRWPNQWGPGVIPADMYTTGMASEAEKRAKYIIDKMKALIRRQNAVQ